MYTPLRCASIAYCPRALRIGLLLCSLPLLLSNSATAHPPKAPEPAKDTLKIQFAGSLFGYYRMEANEEMTSPTLPFVQSFFKTLKSDAASRDLLLGMGDNFSPEFGAAIQQEFLSSTNGPSPSPCSAPAPYPKSPADSGAWTKFAPETLYKSEERLPALAECDNVARFMMAAGYRVIVPGREDFIYSATWLRRVAVLLRGASDHSLLGGNPFPEADRTVGSWGSAAIENKDHQLQLLAANIRVATNPKKKPAAGSAGAGKSSCPLLFSLDLAVGPECAAGDSSISAEMDWLQRIDQTLPKNSEANASSSSLAESSDTVEKNLTSRAEQDSQFRRRLLTNQFAIVSTILAGYQCPQLQGLDKFLKVETTIDKANPESTTSSPQVQSHESAVESNLNDYLQKQDSKTHATFPQTCNAIADSAGDKVYQSDGESLVAVVKALCVALQSDFDKAAPGSQALLPVPIRETAVRLLLHLIASEQRDVGYTIAQQPDGRRVLIVGVVGQETMKEITHSYFTVFPDANDCVVESEFSLKTVCTHRTAALEERKSRSTGLPVASGASKRTAFDLNVGNPRNAVTAILRAAWAARLDGMKGSDFNYVVVMAQMPHTEADELGAHVHTDLKRFSFDCPGADHRCPAPNIDLIVSEAQRDHESGNVETGVEPGGQAPVVTPLVAYDRFRGSEANGPTQWFADPNPISNATLLEKPEPVFAKVSHILQNRIEDRLTPDPSLGGETAAKLLVERFQAYQSPSDLTLTWHQCEDENPRSESTKFACQESVLMQYLLRTLTTYAS